MHSPLNVLQSGVSVGLETNAGSKEQPLNKYRSQQLRTPKDQKYVHAIQEIQ